MPLQAYELRWRMVNPGFLPMRAAQKFMRPVKEMREGFMLSAEGQQMAGVTELALSIQHLPNLAGRSATHTARYAGDDIVRIWNLLVHHLHRDVQRLAALLYTDQPCKVCTAVDVTLALPQKLALAVCTAHGPRPAGQRVNEYIKLKTT